eukprot:g29777.t1
MPHCQNFQQAQRHRLAGDEKGTTLGDISCTPAFCGPQHAAVEAAAGGQEAVIHLLMEYTYAKEVWRKMQRFLLGFVLSSVMTQDSALYNLFDRMYAETSIDCAWRTISSVKDAFCSAQISLVFQCNQLGPTNCCRVSHSKVQDYVLRDTLKVGQLPPSTGGERLPCEAFLP